MGPHGRHLNPYCRVRGDFWQGQDRLLEEVTSKARWKGRTEVIEGRGLGDQKRPQGEREEIDEDPSKAVRTDL